MKAILEFNLPEQSSEHMMCIKAAAMYSVLWEMDQYLRSEIKHGDKEYEDVRSQLHALLEDRGIDLFDMA